MNIHEYQAKELFREFGVAVPEGALATTPEEAGRAAKNLGTPVVVVKAQVHAGGRGKGGGVKVVKSAAEAKTAADPAGGTPHNDGILFQLQKLFVSLQSSSAQAIDTKELTRSFDWDAARRR